MQERYIRDMYIGGAFNTTFSLGERNIRMNDKDIREKLQETLQVECEQLEKDLHWQEERLETLTSSFLSAQFACSRNLISHYMSEFQQKGLVIKTNTRPVYFFWRKSLENRFGVILKAELYETLEDLKNVLAKKQQHAFHNLIGANDSLSYVVEQCKAAISYPEHGLPILLQGPTGTGKSLIAQLMYQYGVEMEILSKDSRFMTMNCSEYANNPEMLMTNLFGYKKGSYTGAEKDTQGLLALADGGILFMDEVHGLKPECQEKIFLFMDKGIYHMVGDNDTWYVSNARLIFATTEQPDEVLLKTLLRRIPLIVKVPSLAERPLQEKRELLQFLIQEEEKHIQRKISISDLVFRTLERHTFTGNIGELKNVIRASVAKAFLRNQKDMEDVSLHIYDLSSDLLESTGKDVTLYDYDDRTMIHSEDMFLSIHKDSRLYNFNAYLIHKFHTLHAYDKDLNAYLDSCCLKLEQYIDSLFTEHTYHSPKLDMINHLLTNIMNIVIHKYDLEKFSNNEISMIVHFLNDYMQSLSSINQLKIQNRKEAEELQNRIHNEYTNEYNVIGDIWQLISDALSFTPGPFGYLDLFLFFRYFNREMVASPIPAVIIAHGYAIASGIAEVANQLLKQRIFDAIDMPIESDFNDTVKKLGEYIKGKENYNEVIVMVDMGSLEAIHQKMEGMKRMDIGIINNVTTKLALDIGSMILEEMPIQEILKQASHRNQYRYEFVKNRKKQDAILAVCETGIGTAEKISKLMEDSLPKTGSIAMIPYDYDSLVKSGTTSLVFEKYNVLFTVGTKDPKIFDVPFISLEEMIEQKSVEKTNSVFESIMRPDQIETFNENMIKNFSMDNLLSYLTILDSDKIIDSVEKIIKTIQKELHMKLSSSVILGLYIHISCLIERLIINKNVTKFEHLETFEKTQTEFIRIVKKAFHDVEQHYNVKIPVSEIGYIYECIFQRDSVKEVDESVNELWDSIE